MSTSNPEEFASTQVHKACGTIFVASPLTPDNLGVFVLDDLGFYITEPEIKQISGVLFSPSDISELKACSED